MRVTEQQLARISLLNKLCSEGMDAKFDCSTGDLLVSDRRESTTRLRLDELGRPVEEITETGRRFIYSYDADGRLSGYQGPEGGRFTFSYDKKGRIKRFCRGERFWSLEWDEYGALNLVRYPDGTETRVVYSAPGCLDSLTMRDHSIIRIERDDLSRIRAIADPRGYVTQYKYGRWDAPDTIYYPDGCSESFVRTTSGRLSETLLNGERWARFAFNNRGDLTRLAAKDEVTSYTYDENGRVTLASNSEITIKREYNAEGRLIKESQGDAVVKFGYDKAGLLSLIITDSNERLHFSYDADGRLQKIQDWCGGQHLFRYSSRGKRVEHQHPNGALTETLLDSDRRPISISTSRNRPFLDTLSLEYEYDVNDRIAQLDDSEIGIRQYCYGSEGELHEVGFSDRSRAEHYQYDLAGNCVNSNGLPAEFGPMNELLRIGREQVQYDERGNICAICNGGERYHLRYNRQNQLVAVERLGKFPIIFAYDGFGRRILKKSEHVTTHYVWAGEVLLAEITNGVKGHERRDYVFIPYSRCPLSLRVNKEIYQYHTDHQGTPRWVTDSHREIVWSADYEAFGAATEGSRKIFQPIRFPGHYFDEETGLHYNRARYYSPSFGRYLSRDPLGFLSGINFYTYAGNDPINGCDPLGLLSFWKQIASAAVIAGGATLMIVAAPVVIAGAAAVATGAAVAAGTAGMVGAFVGGAALLGAGVGIGTTKDDQSAGSQALHVMKYGLIGAGGGASAVLTFFGAAGMAAMTLGGGGGAILCTAGGGTLAVPGSAAPLLAAGGALGMAATQQVAMSQATPGAGGGGGGRGGGRRKVKASKREVIRPGSKKWKQAVKEMKKPGKGKDYRVKSQSEAEQLLKEARGEVPRKPTYTEEPYKKGYEVHPNEASTQNAPQNDLPHLKWKDWEGGKSEGASGHIFFGD